MRSTRELRGVRVTGGRNGRRRIGKILRGVFRPDNYSLVGYIVKRPDLLFMFKRQDRFLAFDSFRIIDGRVVSTIERDSWDAAACKRLGIDWDTCLILEGMDLVTSDGEKVGAVDAALYDEKTGKVTSLESANGVATKTLLGTANIPLELVLGYKDGVVRVKRAVAEIKAEGGLATKAGEQTAVVANVIKEKTASAQKAASVMGKKAGKAAGKAVDKGSVALGKQLGKTRGMFKGFANEYKKARGK